MPALFRPAGILTLMIAVGGAVTSAQSPVSLDVFWIFLHDGRVLSSEGEFAKVGDDLVFVVAQGQEGGVETHDLITVPLAKVDLERTTEYASALRAAKYGATRGEKEYQALTADIALALAALQASDDKDRRLGIAQVARARLASWSQNHFGYRATELRQLVELVDSVIVELQAAAGVSHFSIDLVAQTPPSSAVALRRMPTSAQMVSVALAAASVTEVGVEKLALLRSASRVVATLPEASAELRAEVARMLVDETAVETAYRALLGSALSRADLAVRQGRPAVIRRLLMDVEASDARLGHRRPRDVARTIRRLWAESGLAVDQKAAFDRWSLVKDELEAYDKSMRTALRGWGSHATTLSAIRDGDRVYPSSLDAAARRFAAVDRALTSLHPPDELRHVHGMFRSALQLVRQGLVIGQRLAVASNLALAANASSAITGAEMLRAQGLADLAIALKPRRVR